MSQLRKRFASDQVKGLLDRYLKKEVERSYIQEILAIKRRRFFTLINQYRKALNISLSNISGPPLSGNRFWMIVM